jgi:hypothetical protein
MRDVLPSEFGADTLEDLDFEPEEHVPATQRHRLGTLIAAQVRTVAMAACVTQRRRKLSEDRSSSAI